MPNHSAFITQLFYSSNTGITEFIDVMLKASGNPADYTLSLYTQSGVLYTGSNAIAVKPLFIRSCVCTEYDRP